MNKNGVKILLLLSAFLVLSSGCSQKVSIKVLEPSKIQRASIMKKISVSEFKNDSVSLSDKIETKLANKKIDGKNYFTMISRKDFKKILDEQKIQNSGIIDISDTVEVGTLMGAEAIISGSVGNVSANDTRYYTERIACADKKCKNFTTYRVGCVKRIVGVSADIRMSDIAKGDIIYAQTLHKTSQFFHCMDDSSVLPSKEMAAQSLADKIADEFTDKLSPYYRYIEVSLLEKPDIDYNDKEEELLKFSLEYIRQKRYDKAQSLLIELIDSTDQKSYVAFYDLGVVKEAQQDYESAQKYYNIADRLSVKPVEEISDAYIRIQSIIKKNRLAKDQLNSGKINE